MNAAGRKQNMKIHLKNYSLFRKQVYIAETSHIQTHAVNKLIKSSFYER